MQDHPKLSTPLVFIGNRFKLSQRWPTDKSLEKRLLLRWLDASLPIFLGMLLLGQILNWVEPFGLDDAAKARSQQVSARMMAPFYRSEAQNHIAVVLINDESLDARGIGWPPQYAFYDELLARILAHRPRAVYVDVFLEELRDYDDSYLQALEGLSSTLNAVAPPRIPSGTENTTGNDTHRIPVFFAVSAPGRSSVFADAGVEHLAASWQGAGSAYPLLIGENHEFLIGKGSSQESDVDRRSVALALYQAACPNAGSPGCTQAASELSSQALEIPVSVQWGSTLPVLEQPWPELYCTLRTGASIPARWLASSRLMLDSLFSGISSDIENRKRETCPYTLTVFEDQVEADELLDGGDTNKALLEDRVVLVGTHLIGLNDRVLTPVHQQIPGVYMHAMALDNLMTWGEDRVHSQPYLGKALGLLNSILMSLACGAILLMGMHLPSWWRNTLMITTPLLVGILLVVFAQTVLRQPPQDWIGTALVAVMMGLYVKNRADKVQKNREGNSDEQTAQKQAGMPASDDAVDHICNARTRNIITGDPTSQSSENSTNGGTGTPPSGGI